MPFLILIGLLSIWLLSYGVQRWTLRGGGLLKYDYTWFVGVWIIQMLVLSLPIYEYIENITFNSALFIILAHAAFAGGGMIVMIASPRKRAPLAPYVTGRSPELFVAVGAIVGGVSQLLLSANNIIGSGVSITSRLDANAFAQSRLSNFEFNAYLLGPFIGPVLILTSLCYISIACYAYCFAQGESWTRRPTVATLSVFAASMIVVFHQVVVSGGRIAVAFIIVLVFSSVAIARSSQIASRRRGRIASVALALTVFFGALTGSTLFQQFRGNNADPYLAMLNGHGTSVQPYLYNAVRENELLGNFVLQMSYLTTPPHILSNYLELPVAQQPGPFWGRYNFHTIYRNTARFLPGFDAEFWTQDRAELFLPQIRMGRNPNTWATILRDLNGDFGRIGTILFLLALGSLSQFLADSFYRNRSALKSSLM